MLIMNTPLSGEHGNNSVPDFSYSHEGMFSLEDLNPSTAFRK